MSKMYAGSITIMVCSYSFYVSFMFCWPCILV